MHELETRFARLVVDYRLVIIIASLLVVAAAASGVRLLKFEPDYRVMFDRDNPELIAFDAMEATFTQSDNILFVLAPEDGDIFTAENLNAVKELTDRSWLITYATRVDSITNYQHTEADGDDLRVHDLVLNPSSLDTQSLRRIREIALNEPALVRRLIAADARVAGINVRTLIPGTDRTVEVPNLMASVRATAAEFRARHPNIELHISGQMMLDASLPEAGQRDVQELMPLSFLVLAVGLLVLTRSLSGTLATVIVLALSILAAMGLRGYSGQPLTAFSGNTPIIILTVAVANCVHIVTTFVNDMQRGQAKRAALEDSLRVNLQPVTLASITTSIGFLTLNAVPMPPIGWMGNTAAAGVLIALVLSLTLLPALLSVLPVRSPRSPAQGVSAMERLGRFVAQKRRIFMTAATIVILALIAQIPKNEINENIIAYFDQSFAFRRASDFVEANLTGIFTIDYELSAAEPGGVSEPKFLREVEQFALWLRSQEDIVHVNVLTDTMKRLNKNLHGDDPDWYRLPEQRELNAQYLLLYEMSLPYGLDLNDQINVDKSSIRVSTTVRSVPTRELVAIEARVQSWFKRNAQHIQPGGGVGVTFIFANVVQRNVMSMLVSSIAALIGISLLLAVAFRSLKFGLISAIPNLFPAAMGFGVWGMIHGQIGIFLAVVIGLTLGIVIDDTVHFMSKYLRARRELGLEPEEAVVYSFSTVGRALLVTSLVLVAGFLVVATSPFGANANMGLLTSIVIGLALAADFFFLPPLLMAVEGAKISQTK